MMFGKSIKLHFNVHEKCYIQSTVSTTWARDLRNQQLCQYLDGVPTRLLDGPNATRIELGL